MAAAQHVKTVIVVAVDNLRSDGGIERQFSCNGRLYHFKAIIIVFFK